MKISLLIINASKVSCNNEFGYMLRDNKKRYKRVFENEIQSNRSLV